MMTEMSGRWLARLDIVVRRPASMLRRQRKLPVVLPIEIGKQIIEPLEVRVDCCNALQSRAPLPLCFDDRRLVRCGTLVEVGLVEDVACRGKVGVNPPP